MRENARLLLSIIRDANRQDVSIDGRLMSLLQTHLQITDVDRAEIANLLKADLREQTAMHSDFNKINDVIRHLESKYGY